MFQLLSEILPKSLEKLINKRGYLRLHPHYEATAARIAEQSVVLVAQDTTSLNYDAHPATRDLGPINTRADGAQGLKLHDTLALTPEGVALGLIDIQVWA
jgi:hypothetical protein